MYQSLFEKVWQAHAVRQLANGQTQLLIGTHLIHEVTSPQAFGMLRDMGIKVAMPHRTFATVDHIVPTDRQTEPFSDPLADEMIKELRRNCEKHNITYFDLGSGRQGIVHMVGPEQGITQPGTTIACGDSHTATHGAFGAIAFVSSGAVALVLTPLAALGAVMTPALQGIMSQRVGDDAQGELQGALASISALSMIVSPMISRSPAWRRRSPTTRSSPM